MSEDNKGIVLKDSDYKKLGIYKQESPKLTLHSFDGDTLEISNDWRFKVNGVTTEDATLLGEALLAIAKSNREEGRNLWN